MLAVRTRRDCPMIKPCSWRNEHLQIMLMEIVRIRKSINKMSVLKRRKNNEFPFLLDVLPFTTANYGNVEKNNQHFITFPFLCHFLWWLLLINMFSQITYKVYFPSVKHQFTLSFFYWFYKHVEEGRDMFIYTNR